LFTSLTGGGGITVSQSTGAITLGSTATPLSNVSTIVSRDSSGNFAANIITANLTGTVTGSVSGNAGTVTNGVYTTDTATVTNTMLAGSITNAKLAGSITNDKLAGSITNDKLVNSSVTVNGTAIALGASGTVTAAAGTLTGTTLNATVVTSSLTTVGTLGSLTVTNLVTAKNYSGQVRNLGTITAGAGTEITIDFATDHMVRFNYSTEPIQVAFTNYSAGKTVTLIAVNTSGSGRQLTHGLVSENTQGITTIDVQGDTTAIVTYYCTGSTVDDVFASIVYNPQ
jgi:hypothetical protein